MLKATKSGTSRTAADGTVVEAAASPYRTVKREALEKQLTKAQQQLASSFKVTPAQFKSLGNEHKLRVEMGDNGSPNELLSTLQTYGQVTHFVEVIPSVNDIFIQTVSQNK